MFMKLPKTQNVVTIPNRNTFEHTRNQTKSQRIPLALVKHNIVHNVVKTNPKHITLTSWMFATCGSVALVCV